MGRPSQFEMRRTLWLTVYTVGCIGGLSLIVAGFCIWRDAGFHLGPSEEKPGATRDGGLFLCFLGLALLGYCFFAAKTTLHSPGNEQSDM
jgi:hypothetical protein